MVRVPDCGPSSSHACAVLASLTVKILATVAILGGALTVRKMESRPNKHKSSSKSSGLNDSLFI